ncbi:MAG: hypothetical protein BV457_05735 [Thermoplasmata archaeon M9B1D]|nr:MAG: hypothetical protein BV457_05735 [Thermoplasmata archaeon M9B1D]
MVKGRVERIFSFARHIFFEEVSPKFRTAPFKVLVDYMYVVLEKFACTFGFISKYYLKLYDELVEKEIEMANITAKDNVLVIGCGSLPATSVLSAMKSKAKTVAIDCDIKAVENACKFIKNIGSKTDLEIKHADGLYFPVKDYDVIYVSYGVKQQKEMLEYLSKNINGKTRIIFRTTEDSFKNLVGKNFLKKYFDIKKSLSSDIMYTSDSYLLSKKS